MIVKKCDKCGAVSEKDNPVKSVFTISYNQEWNVAEDFEKPRYERRERKERFDLCEKCAEDFYKSIKGYGVVKKVL